MTARIRTSLRILAFALIGAPVLMAVTLTPGCSGGGGGYVGGGGGFKDAGANGGGMADMAVSGDPACSNGKNDGVETDVDCGGGGCAKCAVGKACSGNADCVTNRCVASKCVPPAANCLDGAQNGDETDVDCGGKDCPNCPIGKTCGENSDCDGSLCAQGVCKAPRCDDGLQNGTESATDCGGAACPKCGAGKRCRAATDCLSGDCDLSAGPGNGFCKAGAPACDDGARNGTETDIDCGGGCSKCGEGKLCKVAGDCQSNTCTGGICKPMAQQPTCNDGVKNGNETDVDCGGGTCPGCADGDACKANRDCDSGTCTNGACGQAMAGFTCLDGLQCINACGDDMCIDDCIASVDTAQGFNRLSALFTCIEGRCPSTNNGACDPNNINYPNSCNTCLMQAQGAGGACRNQLVACQNDM